MHCIFVSDHKSANKMKLHTFLKMMLCLKRSMNDISLNLLLNIYDHMAKYVTKIDKCLRMSSCGLQNK